MTHLMNLIAGMASIFDLAPRQRSYPIRKNGFFIDQKHLRGDVNKLGDDIRKVLNKYGKSSHKSSF